MFGDDGVVRCPPLRVNADAIIIYIARFAIMPQYSREYLRGFHPEDFSSREEYPYARLFVGGVFVPSSSAFRFRLIAVLKPPPAGDPPPLLTLLMGTTAAGTNDPTFVNPARGAGDALED